jgi:hypothetical protein
MKSEHHFLQYPELEFSFTQTILGSKIRTNLLPKTLPSSAPGTTSTARSAQLSISGSTSSPTAVGPSGEGARAPASQPSSVFSSVAGVIAQADQARFARFLFRATHGNTFTYFEEIPDELIDPKTGRMTKKCVFIIYFQDANSPILNSLRGPQASGSDQNNGAGGNKNGGKNKKGNNNNQAAPQSSGSEDGGSRNNKLKGARSYMHQRVLRCCIQFGVNIYDLPMGGVRNIG